MRFGSLLEGAGGRGHREPPRSTAPAPHAGARRRAREGVEGAEKREKVVEALICFSFRFFRSLSLSLSFSASVSAEAPIPWNLSEALWAEIGFETEEREISPAQANSKSQLESIRVN